MEEELIYHNPIIQSDFPNVDAIKVGKEFYMVSASYNYVPGIPVLHSKNLVDWELINHVYDKIPFERFQNVYHGEGAWAPSLRYHDGWFYCLIPFPDEGIYVSRTRDLTGTWSPLWCLLEGKGIIDPCPIWEGDKCYVVVGFAKSRIGFNSVLAVFEATPDLTKALTGYKEVYNGINENPTIEGPKLNKRNEFYYIMAPAGGVKGGWQVCLRSRNIYGPYESKIVLLQNDSFINGPHQGALLEIDNKENWAFIHYQDQRVYGRVVILEPVIWYNDWPICGLSTDGLRAGTPVSNYPYLIHKKSKFSIPSSDSFDEDKLSLIWQTPANKGDNWYKLENGLKLNCYFHDDIAYNSLNMTPNLFLQRICYLNFKIQALAHLNLVNDGDEVGLVVMGSKYHYLSITRQDDKNFLQIKRGEYFNTKDELLYVEEYKDNFVNFNLRFFNENFYSGTFQFGVDKKYFKTRYKAEAGRWVGAKIGIYARGKRNSSGFATFKYFLNKEL